METISINIEKEPNLQDFSSEIGGCISKELPELAAFQATFFSIPTHSCEEIYLPIVVHCHNMQH